MKIHNIPTGDFTFMDGSKVTKIRVRIYRAISRVREFCIKAQIDKALKTFQKYFSILVFDHDFKAMESKMVCRSSF